MSPQISGCDILPADNIWNVKADDLPIDSRSATYINTIGANSHFHMDFGSGLWEGARIGIPFRTVPGTQTKVKVSFKWPDESDAGPYPIPANAPIEGGPNSDGDRHVLVVDRNNCILYELYNAWPQTNGTWKADSGAIYDLNSHALRPAGWTSADAAGLPILPGLVRYSEVASGEITHALRFTVPQTRNTYIWPARHEASDLTGMKYPPMGQRFRLKSDYNISQFSFQAQVIARAMQEYGIILADNGSSWYVSGSPDEGWDNDVLHELDVLSGADFEAVDVSSLMIDPNSGQAKSEPPPAAPSQLSAAVVSPTQINLTWLDNSSDETQFRIERVLSGSGSWNQIGTTSANTTTYSNTNLNCGTTYRYRVRAYRSSDGRLSDYSNTINRTTQSCVAPTLKKPTNNDPMNDETPVFLWTEVTGATQYRIQVDNNADFSSPVLNQILSTARYVPGTGLNNGRHYWRVRASGAGNVWSAWSPVWSVIIDTRPPDVPLLRSPANGAAVTDSTPNFVWWASTGASRYLLQVDNNSNFSSLLFQVFTTSPSYTRPSPLGGHVYYWRVRAQDAAANWSGWSTSRSFTLNAAIIQPTLVIEPTKTHTATSTPVPTLTSTPTATLAEPLYRVESDDPAVRQSGSWTMYDSDAAGGGRYLYSSGSLDDALYLTFTGSQVGIVYVKHPVLGTLAVEVDGVLLQTVDTAAETSIFGEQMVITGLGDNLHTLRVYPAVGVVAIDTFLLNRAPEVIEPSITPTDEVIPTLQPTFTDIPTDTPTEIIVVTGTLVPTETLVPTDIPISTPIPTEIPTETLVPPETPTSTPLPSETPTETLVPTEAPTSTPLPTETPQPTVEATEPAS